MQPRCEESCADGWPWASDVTKAVVCLIVGLLVVLASIHGWTGRRAGRGDHLLAGGPVTHNEGGRYA